MEYNINNEEIMFFGNPNGHYRSKDRVASKFNRVAKIAQSYNEIHTKLLNILNDNKLEEDGRMAFACLLMFHSGIRIGNEGSAEGYTSKVRGHEGEIVQTYGLTTLKPEHVSFKDNKMYLDFIGKKMVGQSIEIEDSNLVTYGIMIYELNKQKETWLSVEQYDLTKFIKKHLGKKFVPKDFRTLAANVKAYKISKEIATRELPQKKREAKNELKEICEKTSEYLGNTPGICKKAYIDERLLSHHMEQRYGK